jgi:hypothetical protein
MSRNKLSIWLNSGTFVQIWLKGILFSVPVIFIVNMIVHWAIFRGSKAFNPDFWFDFVFFPIFISYPGWQGHTLDSCRKQEKTD